MTKLAPTRAEAVAQRAYQQAHEDGDGDGRDIDVGDLRHRQVELAFDDRHQRRAGEPGEEADEEGHPGQVEGTHLRRTEGEKLYRICPGHESLPKKRKASATWPSTIVCVRV
jgi:hypothetical protein